MKLLRVVSSGYKQCEDNITISFVPFANKYEEDKEFELNEVCDSLYVFSTIGIVGKNASGKTTITQLLSIVYDILSFYRIGADLTKDTVKYIDHSFDLDITFYNSGYLYRYIVDIEKNRDLVNVNSFSFKNEKLYKRKYSKTIVSKIFDYDSYELEELSENFRKPEDMSILFNVFNKNEIRALYYSCSPLEDLNYDLAFNLYELMDNKMNIIIPLIEIFDDNIEKLTMVAPNKYEVKLKNYNSKTVSYYELHDILSSGTSKGIVLMSYAVFALKTGCDLIVDEIENHFHKNLVENLINLFKDKEVNKRNATLIFTTHYGELLDQFSRNDNVYIAHNDGRVHLDNVYKKYLRRADVLKSKKFYDNFFGTNVKYDKLMEFKKELMKYE